MWGVFGVFGSGVEDEAGTEGAQTAQGLAILAVGGLGSISGLGSLDFPLPRLFGQDGTRWFKIAPEWPSWRQMATERPSIGLQ